MKLISMTDFVLQELKGKVLYHHLEKVVNYADFLKQKLELWMFVPCKLVEGVWVVLEKPKFNYTQEALNNLKGVEVLIALNINSDVNKYEEAKKRCLFEGFEFKGESEFSWIFKHDSLFPMMVGKRNVEYLTVILNREIKLTQTAQKQIGL